jgi:glycosyltransferase involved in cell wall biosynthesis
MTTHGVSIIVCVHNGATRIIPTLKALAVQVIPRNLACELLIVDNGSTDSTAELATTHWNSLGNPFPLSILVEPKAGKGNALIRGYDSARYELMLLCDDDNWLQPGYLKTVIEIYSLHPEIGLLGGYGKAVFEPGEKPEWFDKWQRNYVCGKPYDRNGFLDRGDIGIWGAGSILRKTMWEFLRSNGFNFHNGMRSGKAIGEDAELSMAITFTGHRLYYDERLWFDHDLGGGRVSWEGLLQQQSLNGKACAILYFYGIGYDCVLRGNILFMIFFIRTIKDLTVCLFQETIVKSHEPKRIYLANAIYEILSKPFNYRRLYSQSLKWIGKVSNTFPLFQRGS